MDSDNVFLCVIGASVVTFIVVMMLILRNGDMHDEKMAELGYQQVFENGTTLWKKVP